MCCYTKGNSDVRSDTFDVLPTKIIVTLTVQLKTATCTITSNVCLALMVFQNRTYSLIPRPPLWPGNEARLGCCTLTPILPSLVPRRGGGGDGAWE